MKNLLNPRWLLFTTCIPTFILLIILKNKYDIIKSLLDHSENKLWLELGIFLLISGAFNLFYALFLLIKKKQIPLYYGIISLGVHILFLYLYVENSNKLLPFSVPRWMVSEDIQLYPWTFLMPALFYSLLIIVIKLTPTSTSPVWKNFLFAICIPVGWFLFAQLIIPLRLHIPNEFGTHLIIILTISSILLFFFFLIRGIYLISIKKSDLWKKYELIWKIPFGIVFPVLGLYFNNGGTYTQFYNSGGGIFGDFSNYWFYILAILNGILLCIPEITNKWIRLILFFGKSITFVYIFYFFLVFLPFLPLSIFAIIFIGAGFLMLTPLLLFIIQTNDLSKEYHYLKSYYSKSKLIVILLAGFSLLPLYITFSYLNDKRNLNMALDYIYTPDYSKNYQINIISLFRTLDIIKYNKEKNNTTFLNSANTPYLSSYFNWLVLNHMTLSDSKIETMEKIFSGNVQDSHFRSERRTVFPPNDSVKISHIDFTSHYDLQQNTWVSQINLELTNHYKHTQNAEYQTVFELPNGCWISNYYLYVEDRKEMGILAEKKSALWLYSQIVSVNRDPGILNYLTGNKIQFRVFPFLENETRKTGIELIHKEPVQLNIDGNLIKLGDSLVSAPVIQSPDKNIVYIPAEKKKHLPKVQREPYYHFIVDISKDKENLSPEYIRRIENLLEKKYIDNTHAKLSFSNTYLSPEFTMQRDWKEWFSQQEYKGGFYLDRAIKSILVTSYLQRKDTYPVLIVVTDSIQNSIIENDFSDFKITYPESNKFYVLSHSGELLAHSLTFTPKIPLSDTLPPTFHHTVYAYPDSKNPIAYLDSTNTPQILVKRDIPTIDEKLLKEKSWNSALYMQGVWNSQVLHPDRHKNKWTDLVKYSFISQIMTPVTSFMVVENEAQKALLQKKQEQVLNSNKSLDLDEETQPMSEPGILLILLVLLIFLGIKNKKLTHLYK